MCFTFGGKSEIKILEYNRLILIEFKKIPKIIEELCFAIKYHYIYHYIRFFTDRKCILKKIYEKGKKFSCNLVTIKVRILRVRIKLVSHLIGFCLATRCKGFLIPHLLLLSCRSSKSQELTPINKEHLNYTAAKYYVIFISPEYFNSNREQSLHL